MGDSDGCRRNESPVRGPLQHGSLVWTEAGLPEVNRKFWIDVPYSYKPGQLTPLVLIFHGWGGKPRWYHQWHFGKLAKSQGFIAVYPQGMHDCANGAQCQDNDYGAYGSWNAVGTATSNNTWAACDVARLPYWEANKGYCYKSCLTRKHNCHKCDWTTCYNDVEFVEKLVEHLEEKYCIDERRVFAYGCSNGGMFVHQLAQKSSSKFAAVAAGCGGKPHHGMEKNFDPNGLPVSMLLIQGRLDHVIPISQPPIGTTWWDGFYFSNVTSVIGAYKNYNRCNNTRSVPYATRYNANNMACSLEGYDCLGNAGVVYCTFDGPHDLNYGRGDDNLMDEPQLVWQFFETHARPAEKVTATSPGDSSSGSSLNGNSSVLAEKAAATSPDDSPSGSSLNGNSSVFKLAAIAIVVLIFGLLAVVVYAKGFHRRCCTRARAHAHARLESKEDVVDHKAPEPVGRPA